MTVSRALIRPAMAAAARATPSGRLTAEGCWAALASRRGMTTFGEKERGEETVYMRRKDKELLEKLLKKSHAKEELAKTELLEILGSHKLPDDVVEKIVYWKEH